MFSKTSFSRFFCLRNLSINLLLIFISLLFVLTCLEIVCRVRYKPAFRVWQSEYLFQLDSQLIYSMRPNFYSDYSTAEFPPPLSINSYGMRDREPGNKDPNI